MALLKVVCIKRTTAHHRSADRTRTRKKSEKLEETLSNIFGGKHLNRALARCAHIIMGGANENTETKTIMQ
jgi:hypothetical protein